MADMRVWVGCLGCYNAGALVGEWVDAVEADSVTIESLVSLVPEGNLRNDHQGLTPYGPHEELWCMDQEGLAPFITGECSPVAAQELAEAVDDMDDDDLAGFGAYAASQGGLGTGNGGWSDWAEARADWEDHRQGIYPNRAEFAADWYEDLEIPSAIDGYIDWDAVGRDLLNDFGSDELPDGRLVVWSY